MQICISGIHTNVGKTHASAMLCAILRYDYYKLIQAGTPTDQELIKSFSPQTKIHQEGYFLKTPASPHIGKKKENAQYKGLSLPIPPVPNLIIETAGGLFTPLDERNFMIDFIIHHNFPTFLIGGYYLGAINHIFLSLEILKQHNIKVLGIIMSGEKDKDIDLFIQSQTSIPLLHLPLFDYKNFIQKQQEFLQELQPLIETYHL